ncbi:hypothetical protein [Kutzneria kofuensis]|uniref:Uncharacterized protein n=1 Tax=Kutzneria kofuensis TaxID=103725 RepID=A0A7W9KF47_9PSEU|nr:hypothetical protein [Kutzneria kofuensis]MBB5891464.1 hypothetical protein [Kutzneria kofuensis]
MVEVGGVALLKVHEEADTVRAEADIHGVLALMDTSLSPDEDRSETVANGLHATLSLCAVSLRDFEPASKTEMAKPCQI